MAVTSTVIVLAILGWLFFAMFCICTVVDQKLPKFCYAFTKVRRLQNKRNRLKTRIAEMKGLKAYREQIKDLEKALGEEAFAKPEEFLDTE